MRVIQVPKNEGKAVIENFDRAQEYNFKVVALSGNKESKPLVGQYKGEKLIC